MLEANDHLNHPAHGSLSIAKALSSISFSIEGSIKSGFMVIR